MNSELFETGTEKPVVAQSMGIGSEAGCLGHSPAKIPTQIPDPTEQPANESRLFERFIDPIDGVMCLSADATAADIAAIAEPHKLRYPLILDPNASLVQQVEATGFAPASSRFGPYCDNILGMNWKRPDGRILRIGERVVKTTTGYDLFRFLLHSGNRFGRPLDYVLRLRPVCDCSQICRLQGTADDVRTAVPFLLQSSWMHWFDSIDFLSESGQSFLRIAVHCPATEWPLFEQYLSSFAAQQTLRLDILQEASPPFDGCPDLTLKTTPDRVVDLAEKLGKHGGVLCVGLCHNGVVHVYIQEGAGRVALIEALVRQTTPELHTLGGDWNSRHLRPLPLSPIESEWTAILAKEATFQ